jgi:hypothetical protein
MLFNVLAVEGEKYLATFALEIINEKITAMETTARKFSSVAEVAQAIGLDRDGLRLLEYLDQYHPDLALDYEFIQGRVSYARQVYQNALEGVDHNDPKYTAYLNAAEHQRSETLMSGLEFSKYSIVENIVDEYCYDKSYASSKEAEEIAKKLLPKVESIFAQYPCDEEFEASCEYDQMMAKLKKKIHKMIDKMFELPF